MNQNGQKHELELQKTLKCHYEGCNSTFKKNRALTNHLRRHTGERPFACDIEGCDKSYTNSSHLKRHKKVSHESVDLTTKCSQCDKTFSNSSNMKRHCARMHDKKRFLFGCKSCSKRFIKKWQLAEHMFEHTGKLAFHCDKCSTRFARMKELMQHKRNHKVYLCVCGRVYHRWKLMTEHRRTCERIKPKCNICMKKFSTKSNLKQHLSTHEKTSDRKVYLCIYKGCSRYYFYKRNLMFHINLFHKKQRKKLPCLWLGCDKQLDTIRNLKQHMINVHKIGPQRERVKVRKPRKDKGLPRLTTAEKLVGVKGLASELPPAEDECDDVEKGDDNRLNGDVAVI